MSFSTSSRDAAVNSLRSLMTSNVGYVSLHTADPGTTGANEVTGTGYTRGSSTFGASSGGSSTGSQASVTAPSGVSTTVTHVGVWTASTSGTFLCGIALSPTETFSTSGGTLKYTPTLSAT